MRTIQFFFMVLLVCLVDGLTEAATLALWNFDDGVPGESAVFGQRLVDSSGNGRDAYVASAAVPEFWDSNPDYGTGAALNSAIGHKVLFVPGHDFGDGGPVAGTAIGDFGQTDSFTLEAIVRFPTSNLGSKYCAIFSKIGTGGSTAVQWWWRIASNGTSNFLLRDSNGVQKSFSSPTGTVNVYDADWHHLAVVRDVAADKLRIYVDYTQLNEVEDPTTGTFVNDGDLNIGSFRDTDNRDLIGSMDAGRISDVALAPSEFLQKLPEADDILPIEDPNNPLFDVPVTSVTMKWVTIAQQDPNSTIASQTVTLATDPDLTDIINTYNGITGNSVLFSDLDYSTVYYWRVDSQGTHDLEGAFDREGPVWSFQTEETAGLVAGWWKFDDVTPGTPLADGSMIRDVSGNNRHLYFQEDEEYLLPSLYDNPYAAYGPGGSYKGFSDGQMQLIPGTYFGSEMAGSPIVLPAEGDLTIQAVVRFSTEEDDYNGILSYLSADAYWYGTHLQQYWLRAQDNGKLMFWVEDQNATSTSISSNTAIYDGQWHHVAVVLDRTADLIRLYIDYIEEASVTDNSAGDITPNGFMVVGGLLDMESRNFEGNIDFVKVTRSMLGPSEFEQPMALPTSPNPVDGAVGLPTDYTLQWTPIDGATITSQTVILATDPYMQNVVDTIPAVGNSASVTGLAKQTWYYWRVDTVGSDSGGPFTRQGPIWSFRTQICLIYVEDGDLDGDCFIGMSDLAILSTNWLRSEYE